MVQPVEWCCALSGSTSMYGLYPLKTLRQDETFQIIWKIFGNHLTRTGSVSIIFATKQGETFLKQCFFDKSISEV